MGFVVPFTRITRVWDISWIGWIWIWGSAGGLTWLLVITTRSCIILGNPMWWLMHGAAWRLVLLLGTMGEIEKFATGSRGLLTRCGWVWVPHFGRIRQTMLEEAHKSRFSIHPGGTKTYWDLRLSYWSPCMKREISWYFEWCLTFWMVKSEHQRTHDKL